MATVAYLVKNYFGSSSTLAFQTMIALVIELARRRQIRAVVTCQMRLRCQRADLIVSLALLNCTVHNETEQTAAHREVMVLIVDRAFVIEHVPSVSDLHHRIYNGLLVPFAQSPAVHSVLGIAVRGRHTEAEEQSQAKPATDVGFLQFIKRVLVRCIQERAN